jgi:glutamate-1-semialdehyde 2,1-aminomutase
MWGHLNARGLPEGYPQFYSRGEGCRIWDVDGREFVDFMCSWGPIILGHRHPEVEEAFRHQQSSGDCFNGPGEVLVELAELFVETVEHADWVEFQKNGSDATTTCVTIARAASRRRKILVAHGAYHGAVPWCSPSIVGVTQEDRAHIIHFDFNNIGSLEAAVAEAGDDLAGIMVSAFRHDFGRDQEMPTIEFARAAREYCDQMGAALILDDVRAGFRLHLAGSWAPLGVRPDLCAWSKAIGNGYPLAAVTGVRSLKEAAASIFVTGSFWCGAASMAAAVATLKVLRRPESIQKMERSGRLLREGLDSLSQEFSLPVRQTGPVQMPMVLFEDDANLRKGRAFCAGALANGAYFHPQHNMFLSVAHTPDDIGRALEAARAGFARATSVSSQRVLA